MNNAGIATEEHHDLQHLKERVDRLENLLLDCQKASLLHYCVAREVGNSQSSSQEGLDAVHELTEAIDTYRVALQLGPRISHSTDALAHEIGRNPVQLISLMKDKVIAQEVQSLRLELQAIRRRHFYLRHFVRTRQLLNGVRQMFYPKLGKLFHHKAVPMGSWGLPPATPIALARAQGLPRISMVTPSFRQGGFIGRTIESVVSQKYPNLEYFVQDGGSEDETVSVLKVWETQLTGWESEPDSGQSEAINKGFQRTSGDIMGWLNSDDLLLPGTLAHVAHYFATHPDVDVVYGHRVLIDERDQEIGRWILPQHDDKVLSWADFVPQETLFWRRSIWNKAGGSIDQSFRFAMDWDLLIRFRDAGARIVRLPYFMGAFRIHDAQKTSASINSVGMQEMDRLRVRCHGRVPTHVDIRSALALYMLRHMIEDFHMRLKRVLGLL